MININKVCNDIQISGDINTIPNSLLIFFRNKFQTFKNNGKVITIKIEDEEETIEYLIKSFERYNILYKLSNDLEQENERVILNQQKFKKFSEKASNIRDNKTNFEELTDFKNSLTKNMIGRKLYNLQFLSAYHLAFSQNACNFSVPGSGKTSIVYGAYIYLKNLCNENIKHIDKILIIGPLSSFKSWEDEYYNCFLRKADSRRIMKMNKTERHNYFQGFLQNELTLISYTTAANSSKDIEVFLKNNKVMVVLDEAHKIKNATDEAYISNAILNFAKYASSRVVLTGTPAPNGYQDIYNLYKFIWPENKIIHFNLNQLKSMSNPDASIVKKNMIPELIEEISPFYIRIKKSDLDNMPEPIDNPAIIVDMDDKQRKIYDYIENIALNRIIENKENKSTLGRIIRLIQVATNPLLLKKKMENPTYRDIIINDERIQNLIDNYNFIPKKFDSCINLIKKILKKDGEKVIVWAYFVDNLFMLQNLCIENKIKSKILYGGTPLDDNEDENNLETREKIINEFNDKDSNLKVLIANPYATSESISLHKVCHNAIYLERNFNCATFIQSKDRIFRYGLKKEDKINYYYIESSKSIDEVIDSRLEEKEKNMYELIETKDIPLFQDYLNNNIDNEDIKEILKQYADRRI